MQTCLTIKLVAKNEEAWEGDTVASALAVVEGLNALKEHCGAYFYIIQDIPRCEPPTRLGKKGGNR